MAGTLSVQKIQGLASSATPTVVEVSSGHSIKGGESHFDTLKGKTTAGSINVQSEGEANTTNLQQGLTKAWFTSNSSMALTDSFNIASVTDVSAGQLGVTTSTAFANTTYSSTGSGTGDSYINIVTNWNETLTTTLTRFGMLKVSNGTYTDTGICGHMCGDLA